MKKTISVIGILAGVLSVIFSFVTFGMSVGYSESSKMYGGDAYTGIQQASAQSANNIKQLAEIAKLGMGAILLIGGLALILYFAMKYCEDLNTTTPFPVNESSQNTTSAIGTSDSSQTIITGSQWRCHSCGEVNSGSQNVCVSCGERKKETGNPAMPGENEWKCKQCGRINQNYVGTCGCGNTKSENE